MTYRRPQSQLGQAGTDGSQTGRRSTTERRASFVERRQNSDLHGWDEGVVAEKAGPGRSFERKSANLKYMGCQSQRETARRGLSQAAAFSSLRFTKKLRGRCDAAKAAEGAAGGPSVPADTSSASAPHDPEGEHEEGVSPEEESAVQHRVAAQTRRDAVKGVHREHPARPPEPVAKTKSLAELQASHPVEHALDDRFEQDERDKVVETVMGKVGKRSVRV
tara:strand:- start:4 stop:663 length:660 start_codon:yes stop_codon:yes gene_type:complete